MKRKRIKPLTKEQKKLVWQKTEQNAGMGWESPYGKPADPVIYEHGGREEDDKPTN